MLPDLEAGSDAEIVADHLRAVQAIYFAHQLESMRAFQVVDRIVERFQEGLLPLGAGKAARLVQQYAASTDRLSDLERKDLYCRVLGAPAGDGNETLPNREFRSLWMRFMTTLAQLHRAQDAGSMAMAPAATQVLFRRAARALAANGSTHGAGLDAAVKGLSFDANLLRAVLEAPEILGAYGARDMWQVIDEVACNELGEAVNVRRYRTLAVTGSTVLQWLVEHADTLNLSTAAGADLHLEDPALIDAVEHWLAACNTQEDAVGSVAEPGAGAAWAAPLASLHATVHDLLRLIGLQLKPAQQVSRSAARTTTPRPGSIMLFCGAPCSGKTLAAHGVAAALGRDLVRVDLRQLHSKYIGEAEKYLDAIIRDAQGADVVLLLDEADALFRQRSAAQNSDDRFANLEIAGLLQRLQAHEGLIIFESSCVPTADDHASKAWFSQVVRFPR